MEKKAITIVGLSGSGKSSVGKLLADALGLPFTDTDKEIERETGKTIPEIFDEFGEKTFREIEKEVVIRSIKGGGVVSLGGGAILHPESRRVILEDSLCFYIKVSIDELERRLRKESEERPLLRGNLRERLEKLYSERKELYEMAHFTIKGDDLSPREICALMAFHLKGFLRESNIYSSLHDAYIREIDWDEIKELPLVTSNSVYRIYGGFLRNHRLEVIPDGEEAKSLTVVEGLYKRFMDWGVERKDVVLALGGGALTDSVGFATATFKRGCDLITIPTTSLAQIDASIGGKTAINLGEVKNVVGTFKVPRYVIIDPRFNLSLEDRRYFEGLVEAIKMAFVRSPELLQLIRESIGEIRRRNIRKLAEIVRVSVELKLRIAERDLFDSSLRHILNFGHTLGHAVESTHGFTHGEAVALGMIFAIKVGEMLGISKKGLLDELMSLLLEIGMPVEPKELNVDKVFFKLSQDKKIKGGKVNFILLKDVGQAILHPLSLSELKTYLSELFPETVARDRGLGSYRGDVAFQGGS